MVIAPQDRALPPRILLVSPQSPFGETSGSRQRTRLYYQALGQLAPTDVLVITQGEEGESSQSKAEGVFHVTSRRGRSLDPYAPDPRLTIAVNQVLPRRLDEYSLVAGRYLWSLCQLELPPSVPSIVDLDDFSYRYGTSWFHNPAQVIHRIKRRLKEHLSRRQLRRFHGLVFVTERDETARFRQPTTVCPNIAPLLSAPETLHKQHPDAAPSLIFVGSMWYGPNRDGIDWFLAKVWPYVKQAQPQATLHIVGAAPPAQRAQWEHLAGVSAPGFVDDLALAYAQADAVIVPVWHGGGSNIKLLEGLAQAKPCIASRFTYLAFNRHLQENEHLLVADDASSFICHCIAALSAPQQLRHLGQHGARVVNAQFNATVFTENLHALTAQIAPDLQTSTNRRQP